MYQQKQIPYMAIIAIFLLCLVSCKPTSPSQEFSEPPELFIEPDADTIILSSQGSALLEQIKNRPTAGRYNLAMVNLQALNEAVPEIQLSLFPDLIYTARLESLISPDAQTRIWRGQLLEVDGRVTLVDYGNLLTGMIRVGSDSYAIEPVSAGVHVIYKINPAGYPPEHPPENPNGALLDRKTSADVQQMPADIEFPLVFTVLVAYTNDTANHVGSIAGTIHLAVDEANQAYQNSNALVEMQLVHSVEVDYASSTLREDVERLEGTDDGYMDDIHSLRNQYGADIVVLLVDNNQYCGLASAILANEDSAFAAVYWNCATGDYSFAHEIGHLQGCRHNPEADPSTNPFPFGHGYLLPNIGVRSIMAYDDIRNCINGTCTREQLFSNPNVTHAGVPFGDAECCDNARVLEITATYIAGFRITTDSGGIITESSNQGRTCRSDQKCCEPFPGNPNSCWLCWPLKNPCP